MLRPNLEIHLAYESTPIVNDKTGYGSEAFAISPTKNTHTLL